MLILEPDFLSLKSGLSQAAALRANKILNKHQWLAIGLSLASSLVHVSSMHHSPSKPQRGRRSPVFKEKPVAYKSILEESLLFQTSELIKPRQC